MPSYSSYNVKNRRIMSSIFSHGLLPHSAQRKVRANSSDTPSDTSNEIFGNLLNPAYSLRDGKQIVINETGSIVYEANPSRIFHHEVGFKDSQEGKDTYAARNFRERFHPNWRDILYEGRSAILPVLAERSWITPASADSDGDFSYQGMTKKDCEKRIRSSMLVVARFGKIKNGSLSQSIKLDYEYAGINNIPFSKIDYLLIPAHLKPMAEKIFPKKILNTKIRFVQQTKKRIDVYKFYAEMEVPDYQKVLEQIMKNNPNRQYWIHGVRLETRGDSGIEEAMEKRRRESEEFMKLVQKNKGLETKVAGIVGIASLLLSLFFLYSNISGFAISNLNPRNSSLLGIILFILGIANSVIYLRRKK